MVKQDLIEMKGIVLESLIIGKPKINNFKIITFNYEFNIVIFYLT